MSTTTKASITLTLGYEDTDETRDLKIDNVSVASLSGVVNKVKAKNASLEAGTDGGLSTFFLSEDGDNFNSIVSATATVQETTPINLND